MVFVFVVVSINVHNISLHIDIAHQLHICTSFYMFSMYGNGELLGHLAALSWKVANCFD